MVDPNANAGAGLGLVPNPPWLLMKPLDAEEVPEPNTLSDGEGEAPNIPPDGAGAPNGDEDVMPDPKPTTVEPNADGAKALELMELNPPPNPRDAGAGAPKIVDAPPLSLFPPNGEAEVPNGVFCCPKPLVVATEPNIFLLIPRAFLSL